MYNKFHNKITEVDRIKFRSKAEAKRYSELKMFKGCGDVKNFKMQVPYILCEAFCKKIRYYADFVVEWKDGSITVEDVKGVKTPLYKLKRMLMMEKFGINVIELR
jgi:hypothetical protein